MFRHGLSRALKAGGYELTFSNVGTYRKSVFRGHFDFITSQGYSIDSVQTLPRGASDHMPILIDSKRSQAPLQSLQLITP